MATEISACIVEGCDEFTYTDTTGPYDPVDNPYGYGVPNWAASPNDFSSYILEVWIPGNTTETPDYIIDLRANVPEPDAEGHYSWVVTAESVGQPYWISGVYYMRATAVFGDNVYIEDIEVIFTKNVKKLLDDKMRNYDPECGCKKGCQNPLDLFVLWMSVSCGGICDKDSAQAIINDLYYKVPKCC